MALNFNYTFKCKLRKRIKPNGKLDGFLGQENILTDYRKIIYDTLCIMPFLPELIKYVDTTAIDSMKICAYFPEHVLVSQSALCKY